MTTSIHGTSALSYPPLTSEHGDGVMSENEKPVQIEWITTVEAAKILKVNSTQAVRNLMVRNPDELPGMNIGTVDQPRWMLRRADVIRFQKKREAPEN